MITELPAARPRRARADRRRALHLPDASATLVAAVIDIVRVGVPVARCDLIDARRDARRQRALGARRARAADAVPRVPRRARGGRGADRDGARRSPPSTAAASSRGPRRRRSARRCGGPATRPTSPGAGCARVALAYTTDICVPISALAEMIALAERLLDELPFPGPMVGHVADGNFHCQLLVRDDDERRARARQAVRRRRSSRARTSSAGPAPASTGSASASARRSPPRWARARSRRCARSSARSTRSTCSTPARSCPTAPPALAARVSARATPIDRRLRNVALLVAGCFFMENFDGTIVTTAAPRIGVSLHVSADRDRARRSRPTS